TRAGLDDVGRRALARHERAVEVDLDGHFAERVLARGGRANRVILEPAFQPRDRIDGRQRGVDRAVADAGILVRLAVLPELDGGRGNHAGATDDVQVLE